MDLRLAARIAKTISAFALAGLACGLVVPNQHAASAVESPFTFNWAQNPTEPLIWHPKQLNDWDLFVHDSGMSNDREFTSGVGQHGVDCSPYPATHAVSSADEAVFICRNHLMTMLNAGGYGEVVMTPAQIADFADSQVSISWNVTTLRTTTRDWIEINVTPFQENLVAPADTSQDFEGEPMNTVNCSTTDTPPTVWACQVISHGETMFSSGFKSPTVEEVLRANGQPPSATARTRYQLDLTASHLRLSLPAFHTTLIDANVNLPFTSGVVQLSEHDYDVGKDCVSGHHPNMHCVNNTWHWSDFSISNARPFTMIRLAADTNAAIGGGKSKVNFALPQPLPPESYLRFLGSPGEKIRYSVNDGPFQAAPEQAATKIGQSNDKNFFIPLPTETRSVAVVGEDWGGGHWLIQDPAIWSMKALDMAALTNPAPGTGVVAGPTQPAPQNQGPDAAAARAATPSFRRAIATMLTAMTQRPESLAVPGAILLLGALAAVLAFRRRRRSR